MRMPSTAKRPAKPTVFLSHSSKNRRELIALKSLLDDRAGGLIEFFLSSDEESIAHGTIWPVEVREALDRMSLMLIFVSPDALKSGWTYFEAGYGLHKLDVANIYCLPGIDKATLPPPFNILQNRNLHSARDLTSLIREVNKSLEARMNENVSKSDFDRLFKKPSLNQVETGPPLDQMVEYVSLKTTGPHGSMEIFCRVCREHNFPVSDKKDRYWSNTNEKYSTGVSIAVEIPGEEELLFELPITDEIQKRGHATVVQYSNGWRLYAREYKSVLDTGQYIAAGNQHPQSH